MDSPLHTRLRFCPSGPMHIGHVALTLLATNAAESTGGSFCIRCTHLKATRGAGRWKAYRTWVERNLDELLSVGIDGSPPKVFLAHGMSPRWRVQRQDETALTQHYWHDLGFDRVWGEWPLGDEYLARESEWYNMSLGNYQQGHSHPFIRLAQVVGDVCTGRTCVFRGDDHLPDRNITNAFAQAVAMRHYHLSEPDKLSLYAPNQYFLPKLRRASGTVLASGDQANTTGFYIADFLEAKLPIERLNRFIERVLFRNPADAGAFYSEWLTPPGTERPAGDDEFHVQEGVQRIMSTIRPEPVVDDVEWAHFLKTGDLPEWEDERER